MPTSANWKYGSSRVYWAELPPTIRAEVMALLKLEGANADAFWLHLNWCLNGYLKVVGEGLPSIVERRAAVKELTESVDKVREMLKYPFAVGGIADDLEMAACGEINYRDRGGFVNRTRGQLSILRNALAVVSGQYHDVGFRMANPKMLLILNIISGFRHFGLETKNTDNPDSGERSQFVKVLIICFKHVNSGIVPGDLKPLIKKAHDREQSIIAGETDQRLGIFTGNNLS